MLSQQQFIVQLLQRASDLTDESAPSTPESNMLLEPYAFYGGAGAHMHPHPLPMLGETAEDEDRHIPHPIGRH